MLCDCYVKLKETSTPSNCYKRGVALIRFLRSSLLHVANGTGLFGGKLGRIRANSRLYALLFLRILIQFSRYNGSAHCNGNSNRL